MKNYLSWTSLATMQGGIIVNDVRQENKHGKVIKMIKHKKYL